MNELPPLNFASSVNCLPAIPQAAMHLLQVFGMSKTDVLELFEALRAEGDLQIIGEETSIFESDWLRHVAPLVSLHSSV